jgi:hypothetical protein
MRAWSFCHHLSGVRCLARYDGAILETEIDDDEPEYTNIDAALSWWELLADTCADLEQAGVRRTALPSPVACERELRLIADRLVEEAV